MAQVPEHYTVIALSDATGQLAMNIAYAAVRQFEQDRVTILRRSSIKSAERIREVIDEAKTKQGIVVFTLVSIELRRSLADYAQKKGVIAIDLMGPVMNVLSAYFHKTPSDEPGLKYQMTSEYYQRTEAVDFSVKHDDGLGAATLADAQVLLLGISRTGKTPLSIYLAHQGYRVANIPIVMNLSLPSEVTAVDRKKMVGLTVSPEKLAQLRSARLKKLGRPDTEDYAKLSFIREECQYAQNLFRQLGHIPTIDVTEKAIEEIATEIQRILSL